VNANIVGVDTTADNQHL